MNRPLMILLLAATLGTTWGTALARYIQPDPVGIVTVRTTPRPIMAHEVLRLNHPYLYVRANPLRFIDPLGLTEQDISNMVDLVNVTQGDLNVPKVVYPMDLGQDIYGNPIGGITNPFTLQISINDRYLQKLSCKELEGLFETITHESIHRTRPRSDMFARPSKHQDIYDDAARRTREARDLIRNYCPCP
jgi:hypothetical protein